MSLVRALAMQVRKQLSPCANIDDLVAYGMQGLLEAADRFDSSYGIPFATFAYHRIRGAIYDGIRDMTELPRAEYARLRAAERVNEYLGNLAERESGSTGVGSAPIRPSQEDDLRALQGAFQGVVASYLTSLDALGDEGNQLADGATGPEETVSLREACARVRQAIGSLPERERHFIEMHYYHGKTLKDLGAELGLSKSWASRLHARAIGQLAELLKDG